MKKEENIEVEANEIDSDNIWNYILTQVPDYRDFDETIIVG